MLQSTSTAFSGQRSSTKFPSMSVFVPSPLSPCIRIVTKGRGEPSSEEVTLPVTLVCAKAVVAIITASTKKIDFFMKIWLG